MTRGIKPHKGDESGGRTERFAGRCTKRIKRLAGEIKLLVGVSAGDLFAEAVEAKYQEILADQEEQNATKRYGCEKVE